MPDNSKENPNRSDGKLDRRQFLTLVVAAGTGAFLGGGLTDALFHYADQQNKAQKEALGVPQGYWVKSEMNGTTLHAEINAYMLEPDLDIDHVNITIQDENGNWIVVADLTNLDARTNTFITDVDLSQHLKPGEKFPVSFNVYGTNGKRSEPVGNERQLQMPD